MKFAAQGLLTAVGALFLVLGLGLWALAHGGGGTVHLQCEIPQGEPLKITVHGGREFAAPGEVFGFDVEALEMKRCQPVEITFINTDDVRHAFMIDGLSPTLMLELPGKGEVTGTFVAPDEDATMLLHCHVPGHDRAGMFGSAVVGRGDATITTSGQAQDQNAWPATTWVVLAMLGGFILGGVGVWTMATLK